MYTCCVQVCIVSSRQASRHASASRPVAAVDRTMVAHILRKWVQIKGFDDRLSPTCAVAKGTATWGDACTV
jgi:hypothetical protein